MALRRFTKKSIIKVSLIHVISTLCVMVAVIVTNSMVALAGTGKTAGELIITTGSVDAGDPTVTVNGEAAVNGRTIFSSSTISTPDGYGAIISLGKTGKIELAPNTVLLLTFDDSSIHGELTSGSITVLNAAHSVEVKTLAGVVEVNAGESAAAASSGSTSKKKYVGALPWWVFAAIIGGIVVGVIVAVNHSNNNNTVSPTS